MLLPPRASATMPSEWPLMSICEGWTKVYNGKLKTEVVFQYYTPSGCSQQRKVCTWGPGAGDPRGWRHPQRDSVPATSARSHSTRWSWPPGADPPRGLKIKRWAREVEGDVRDFLPWALLVVLFERSWWCAIDPDWGNAHSCEEVRHTIH